MKKFTEVALETLPRDTQIEIFKRLEPDDVLNLCNTSRSFAELCSSDMFWLIMLRTHFDDDLDLSKHRSFAKRRYLSLAQNEDSFYDISSVLSSGVAKYVPDPPNIITFMTEIFHQVKGRLPRGILLWVGIFEDGYITEVFANSSRDNVLDWTGTKAHGLIEFRFNLFALRHHDGDLAKVYEIAGLPFKMTEKQIRKELDRDGVFRVSYIKDPNADEDDVIAYATTFVVKRVEFV